MDNVEDDRVPATMSATGDVGADREIRERARQSRGISNEAIYRMVARALRRRGISGGRLLDLGCGVGDLVVAIDGLFDRYTGADVVEYPAFRGGEFLLVDPATGRVPLPDGTVDVAAAVETIEHLENPRSLMRELGRLVRPGGWVVVTTPNQLSLMNLLSLWTKGTHVQFQDVHYPTHLSALLEIDLRRMAAEIGLADVGIEYSGNGRIPGTGRYYPLALSARFGRRLSDNVLMIGRKPEQAR
jgi:2-polyprenyl-3-methyl-5-hydroxy-6-metoxy-1,4-benzoquinol methylase